MTSPRRDHLTFRGNLKQSRYGWLRLTPAFSVHLVAELLDSLATDADVVLDPFCGTGTTALVCAERGLRCITTDINPFLVWLARAKTRSYTERDRLIFEDVAREVSRAMRADNTQPPWLPALHQISKWWGEGTLGALGRGLASIKTHVPDLRDVPGDLLRVAFCRTLIERANVSFGHQSMSFKTGTEVPMLDLPYSSDEATADVWLESVRLIDQAAATSIYAEPATLLCDARQLHPQVDANSCSCVITSPPYPNRMSYIRELRPYMYWLGYLQSGREAGELDWQAIGGTWGCATSNVAKWNAERQIEIPYDDFADIVMSVEERSPLLARYIHKYFYDMMFHCQEVYSIVRSGGSVHYIVGNSKFYDVVVPVEMIYRDMLASVGFINTNVRSIRKRTSKKELFEYVVSAEKPS